MATTTVDLNYLSTYLGVSQPSISSLIEQPSKVLVYTLLQAITYKAKQHDEEKAHRMRLDVELDHSSKKAAHRICDLKAQLKTAREEADQLKEKLRLEEAGRHELEDELRSVKSSAANAESELHTLRSRVSSLESSNRDTVALLEAKSTAHDRLAGDLATQNQKNVDLRRQISEVEQALQAANAASTTAKYRESGLQQELELVRHNNEWLEGELKTKTVEYSKSRKERNAKIAELQRQNEDARSNLDSLKRTETVVRARLGEVEQKAEFYFNRIRQMQEEAARKEEDVSKELESRQRLAGLFEASANTARDRLQEVQATLVHTKDEVAEDIGRVRAEVESERAARETAERRVLELEVQVERLEADITNLPNLGSLPETPQLRIDGSVTPSTGTPGGSRLRGNLNFTQMYTEYMNIKAQLEMERRRNTQMNGIIADMIQDLESKQPEIEFLRTDHERLESEMLEVTNLLEKTNQERDRARKEARKREGQVAALELEGEVLRQQLRDLGSQVKVLLTELHARDQGLEPLDSSQQAEIGRLARGEVDEHALDDLTDTGRLISRRLTIFHNVDQLQEQNTKLLRLTRELGDRMEGDEARKQQSQQAKDREELEELRKKAKSQEDDLKSLMLRSDSYLKERDMFRRMLQHRGQLPPGSASPSEGPRTPGMAQSPTSKEVADLSQLLKEMQTRYDSYRIEAATDYRALKDQSERISKEKAALQAELVRSNGQVLLARERLEMLQSNFKMMKNENIELQKRSNSLAETAAKQDLKTQQVAEDLVESRGLVDSLQKEMANLKAEKDLWKRIETRLMEDNEALVNEKYRLNELIKNLQTLQNEREMADAESRRNMQNQIEGYTAELQSIRRKFDEEVEDVRKTALHREHEAQQSQKKMENEAKESQSLVEDLRSRVSQLQQELVAAQTTKDHLQTRVNELTVEVRSAGTSPADGEHERALSREQELSEEVAELKRDLELAQSELRQAKEEVEQFKTISQSSEEELQSLNDTYEQYRQEIDRLLSEKDARIREVEQALEELRTEMTNATSEISNLQAAQAERAHQVDEEQATLEAEIARLKDDVGRHSTAARAHQEDLKAQAEIAQRAQQSYEHELLKHAEAAKSLQEVRKEHNEMKTEIVQLKTDSEAASVALSQSKSSWEETKERYEREIQEMRSRRDDVNKQNDLLHKQLESVTLEIAALQQQRSNYGSQGGVPSTPGTEFNRSIEELREVIIFMRRDKEIVDVQYEMAMQEGRRLKQQFDYTQSQLEECTLRLDQERRARVEGDRMSMTHQDLLQKITELNLYRESAVTLRNEAREAQSQLAEKAKRVEELIAEVQPLRATVQELQNEKETHEGEMKLLQDDRDRWQQRAQNILQKYDRIDPAEMEELKEQISTLRTEHAQLLSEKEQWQPLKEQVESIPEQIEKAKEEAITPWRERVDKQVAQFKERSRKQIGERNEKILECQQLTQEKEELERQLTASKEEVERSNAQRDEALASVEQASQGLSAEEKQAMEERVAAAERAAREHESKAQSLQTELSASQTRIAALELQILRANFKEQVKLQQTLEEANTRVTQLQALKAQDSNNVSSEWPEELERLEEDLRNAQQEIDDLRTTLAVNASVRNVTPDDGSKTIAEQVSEQVEAIKQELDIRHAERVQQAETQYQQRADKMKVLLSKKLSERKDQVRQTLEAEHNERMEALKKEHQQEIEELTAQHQQGIEELTAQHQDELDRLKKDEALRFEQEKRIWLADNASAHSESNQTGQIILPEGSVEAWVIPEPQIREFVRVNPIIQGILKSNINSQAKKVKDDQEKIMEDKVKEVMATAEKEKEAVVAKAEKEKEQAIAMETQRQKVKLSMAEGKARTLAAKTDLMQAAAQETPHRPVAEVWEMAKIAKPAPATTPSQPAGQPTQTPTSQPAGQQAQAPTSHGPQPGVISQSTIPQPVFGSSTSQIQQQQAGSFIQNEPQPVFATMVEQPISPLSSLPNKPPQTYFGGNVGTGPSALRGIIGQGQSMLPRAPGGNMGRNNREGNNVLPNIQTQIPAPQVQIQNQNYQDKRGQSSGRRGNRHRGNRGNNAQNNQYEFGEQQDLKDPNEQYTPAGEIAHTGGKRQRGDGDYSRGGNGKRYRGS
ncbi:MAG: hypothetical protein M1816_006265 [Peltula sp. TS41687]|nr:MAG: hypothetical protein M1816_006265 [Peltula sp. TS41687]